jgi:hypothetical protein
VKSFWQCCAEKQKFNGGFGKEGLRRKFWQSVCDGREREGLRPFIMRGKCKQSCLLAFKADNPIGVTSQ